MKIHRASQPESHTPQRTQVAASNTHGQRAVLSSGARKIRCGHNQDAEECENKMRYPHTHAGWGDKAFFAGESNPIIRHSLKADRVDMSASLRTTIKSHNGTKGVNGLIWESGWFMGTTKWLCWQNGDFLAIDLSDPAIIPIDFRR